VLVTYECAKCGHKLTVEKRMYASVPNVFVEVSGEPCPRCGTVFKGVAEVDFNLVRRGSSKGGVGESSRKPYIMVPAAFELGEYKSQTVRRSIALLARELEHAKSWQELVEAVASKLNVPASELSDYLAQASKAGRSYTCRLTWGLKEKLKEASRKLRAPQSHIVLLAVVYSHPELYTGGRRAEQS